MYTDNTHRPIIGRFAPSPTGELHLGSLVTALASFCHIKSLGGRWLVRLEDTDFERCKPAFSDKILFDLDALGLHWDEKSEQSARTHLYEDAIYDLPALIYACHCSRKTLAPYHSPIYPRLCTPKAGVRHPYPAHTHLRLMLPDENGVFFDGIQGKLWQNPQKLLGDVVIKRNNGLINYIWACAIDDGLQNISHVMRGLDILPMTLSQRFIQSVLTLPTPDHYYHLPLLFNADGQKLSKQNLARPIDTKNPSPLLVSALALLGQNPPAKLAHETPAVILDYAVHHWDNRPLIKKDSLGVINTP